MQAKSAFLAAALTLALGGCAGGGGGLTPAEPLPEGEKGKWTVLVFMNAANDLYRYSPLNMNQMERVAGNPEVRFVVQWKQSQSKFSNSTFDGTRRYLARPDKTPAIAARLVEDLGDGVDMGSAQTLRQFVSWGKKTFPADRYLLVVWNHGNGWKRAPVELDSGRAVSYDDETGNAIQIWQLQAALQGLGMDAVAFDASLMQMAEVAYELRNVTPLVIGSEESPPGEGYPYDAVFQRFQDSPDADAKVLSKGFVDGMLGVPQYETRKITQSVLDSSRLDAVAAAASALGDLLRAKPGLQDQVVAARNASQGYSLLSSRRYFDMIGFCDELAARTADTELDAACAAVKAAVQASIVWEGHNAQSAGSRGLAVDLSANGQFRNYATDYAKLEWAEDTTWDDWLAVAP